MPELPEVEIAARNLRRWGGGRLIRAVWADPRAKRVFRPWATAAVARSLTGARIGAVRRIGKNLLVTLGRGAAKSARQVGLWSHLGMTGKWVLRQPGDPRPSHARMELTLDDESRLLYLDPRMFGRLRWVPDAHFDEIPELAALGPDPLVDGIEVRALADRLSRVRRPIKVALLDQSVLAGVGNIQASEALFRARIDPRRPASSLSRAEVGRLRKGILASIAFTLDALSDSDSEDGDIHYVEEDRTRNPFLVYDRAGEACPRSRGAGAPAIVRIVQAGRATFFCPDCQRT